MDQSILYLDFPEQDSKKLQEVLSDIPLLEQGINYIKLIKLIEPLKLTALAELVKKSLKNETKIFIILHFIDNLQILADLLSDYNPIIVKPNNVDFLNEKNKIFIMIRHSFLKIKDQKWPFQVETYLTIGWKDLKSGYLICDNQNKQERRYTARYLK